MELNADIDNCFIEKDYIPWVEKYRPTVFDDIVLEESNRRILENILHFEHFPNLLFYGPPGTGKTTTIINLINKYQELYSKSATGLMIHLNASDERGIDIIRNQINQFVNSKALFNDGMKFVILDEVDYMTKNAQQALRYLLETCPSTVRFCLICNYISRIDDSLQNEFIRLRFNQLPESNIIDFLQNIAARENIDVTIDNLKSIQRMFNSDMRSMVNYMQSNQTSIDSGFNILNNTIWEELYKVFSSKKSKSQIMTYINNISKQYSIDKNNIIKSYLSFIIRNKESVVTPQFLSFCENLLHSQNSNNPYFMDYACSKIIEIQYT